MCNICVFAGTTEGRELVEFLAGQPVQATVCVATEYGETLLPEAENITILAGRIPVEDIIRMLQRMRFDLVIDATHPYATSITESICTACRETQTEYLRLLRQSSEQTEDVVCVENAADASVLPALAEAYGTLTVKKLYLHMGDENVIHMDWNVPLDSMGGKTSQQLAQEAFLLHVTQQKTSYVVTDEGKTGNAKFSLVYTEVGPDAVGGDFFENVE